MSNTHDIISTYQGKTHNGKKGAQTAKESKAHAEWTKANSQTFSIRLHNAKDKDIIDHLAKQPSRQGYIKELIRRDMQDSHLAKP